jgi:uncharacterized protein
MHLSEIYIYPVKSLGGISLQSATAERRGLQHDRRWMLTDEQGRFLTQREIPHMALLGTAIEPPHLVVFEKKNPASRVLVPLPTVGRNSSSDHADLPQMMVEIWGDRCAAQQLPPEISDWFSDILGKKMRLVRMPDTTRRPADAQYAPPGHVVSFADGFPFLLIGQASLDDLNSRLAQPLPMNRFRPNFVFTGGQPFEEDGWSDFRIGEVPFRGVKPCARCPIPTTDQDTAARAAEPLKTLATYRQSGHKILFGQNVLWMGEEGEAVEVKVGERVAALSAALPDAAKLHSDSGKR